MKISLIQYVLTKHECYYIETKKSGLPLPLSYIKAFDIKALSLGRYQVAYHDITLGGDKDKPNVFITLYPSSISIVYAILLIPMNDMNAKGTVN
ncbi:MAG: hypothetical protein QNK20_01775 [Aureibaculum sp.]|nr:hypothetical protein [Aureibaculum sp.]